MGTSKSVTVAVTRSCPTTPARIGTIQSAKVRPMPVRREPGGKVAAAAYFRVVFTLNTFFSSFRARCFFLVSFPRPARSHRRREVLLATLFPTICYDTFSAGIKIACFSNKFFGWLVIQTI